MGKQTKKIKITFNYKREPDHEIMEVPVDNSAQENHELIQKKFGHYDVIKHENGLLYENVKTKGGKNG